MKKITVTDVLSRFQTAMSPIIPSVVLKEIEPFDFTMTPQDLYLVESYIMTVNEVISKISQLDKEGIDDVVVLLKNIFVRSIGITNDGLTAFMKGINNYLSVQQLLLPGNCHPKAIDISKEYGCDTMMEIAFLHLSEETKAAIKWMIVCPAGKSHHGAVRGGLLHHQLGVRRAAIACIEDDTFDSLLLEFAALTHDLFKMTEYVIAVDSDTGKQRIEYDAFFVVDHGHIISSVVINEALAMKKSPTLIYTTNALSTMYATHHGQWAITQLQKNPHQTLCQMLHAADMIDSRTEGLK